MAYGRTGANGWGIGGIDPALSMAIHGTRIFPLTSRPMAYGRTGANGWGIDGIDPARS